jgi:glycerate 2-kinase
MSRSREDALKIFLYALKCSCVETAMEQRVRFEGVVVGPKGPRPVEYRFRLYGGGHPSPNEASVEAASDILRTLEAATERDLVRVSGEWRRLCDGGAVSGAQNFVERDGCDPQGAGRERSADCGHQCSKEASLYGEGGWLAAAAAPAEQLTILVSDVPEGELDALSSGPTLPDRSTMKDVYRIVQEYGLDDRFPMEITDTLARRGVSETPKPGDAIFARSQWSLLLDSVALEEAAALRARKLGWTVEIDNACDDWSADRAAAYLVERMGRLRSDHERVCLLSAGEVTVQVEK